MQGAPRPTGWSARRTYWTWFAVLGSLCLAWVLSTPLYAVPDEQAHAERASVVAHGDFFGGKDVDTGTFGVLTEVHAPKWFEDFDPACFIGHTEVTPECVRAVPQGGGDRKYLIFMGAYGPWFYLGEGVVTHVADGRTALYLMRIVSTLACAALLAGAFVSARRLGRWSVLGVAAAATPMAFYLAGAVNPNGLEIASAIAIWAGAVALARAREIDERLLAGTVVAFAICVNTRGLSLGMGILALAVPMLLVSRTRAREIRRLPHFVLWAAVAVAATVVSAGWSLLNGIKDDSLPHVPFTVVDGVDRSWRLYVEAVAVFGWSEVRVPAVAVIWGVVLIGLVVLALAWSTWRERAAVVLAAVLAFAVPTIISIAQPPPIHVAWYGRYGLPISAGVPVLAGALIALHRPSADRPDGRFLEHLVPVAAALLAFAQVAGFAVAARRYTVGTGGAWLYFLDPTWSPPVPPWLLLLLAAGAATTLAWLVARSPVEDPGPVRARREPVPATAGAGDT